MANPADADPAGTEPGGTEPGGTEPGGTEPGGTEPGGTEPGGTKPVEADLTGAEPTEAEWAKGKPGEGEPAGADLTEGEPTGGKPAEAERRRRRRGRALTEVGVIILVTVLVTGLVRTFAFQPFWIPSASMVPTLGVYDRVLVQKAFFSWRDVREGDIVVFSEPPLDHCPGPPGDLVKRVIGLPGQTVYSSGNSIYIDGRRLAEPYLPPSDPLGPPIPGATPQHPYRVPAGEFYVLGDNRADSCDSRFWGPIEGSSIVGRVVLTFWHDSHPVFHRF